MGGAPLFSENREQAPRDSTSREGSLHSHSHRRIRSSTIRGEPSLTLIAGPLTDRQFDVRGPPDASAGAHLAPVRQFRLAGGPAALPACRTDNCPISASRRVQPPGDPSAHDGSEDDEETQIMTTATNSTTNSSAFFDCTSWSSQDRFGARGQHTRDTLARTRALSRTHAQQTTGRRPRGSGSGSERGRGSAELTAAGPAARAPIISRSSTSRSRSVRGRRATTRNTNEPYRPAR